MNSSMRFLPEAASQGAGRVDLLSLALLAVTTIFSVGIAIAIVIFSVRYWHRREVNRERLGSTRMHWVTELTWTGIPLLIVLGLFGWGAAVYFHDRRPPADALDVYVVAKQWMWKIGHEGGRREIDTLHLPAGRQVRLTMISEDVIHSFFVPAFRSKQDVLPGRFTTMWFEPNRPGTYHLFCAEYCGTSHSQMVGKVIVQEPEAYAAWLEAEEATTPAQAGRRWVETFGCLQCHGAGATENAPPGPSLAGLYGTRVPLQDGTTVIADENYLRRAIVDPQAHVVAGFQPRMPSFEGEIDPSQLAEIVAYLKSVADASGPIAGPGNSQEP